MPFNVVMGTVASTASPGLPPRLNAGAIVADKYRVERVIGTGGMGVVVEARHLQLDISVAIKLLTVCESSRPDAAARFLREARAAAALTSDHVVRIYDIGTLEDGTPFMVMERLHGLDLATLLEDEGVLSVSDAVEFVSQAAAAIAEAHEHGIVHRDLKPSNLFVTQRGDGAAMIKVLDFGISKSVAAGGKVDGDLTQSRALLGSPAYMSPEQIRDAKNVDPRTDIWSLGVILHELLVGGPVFDAASLPGICAAIVADAPTPLRAFRPNAPDTVEAVVLRCLQKDPALRFQSMQELIAALEPIRREARPSSVLAVRRTPRDATPMPFGMSNAATLDAADGVVIRDSCSLQPCSQRPETVRSTEGSAGKVRRALGAIAKIGALAAVVLAVGRGGTLAASTDARGTPSASEPRPTASTFAVCIESVPTGADVFDGDRRIGTTPLQVTLVKERVSRQAATFSVRHSGYQPYSLVQSISETNVRFVAELFPDPPPIPATATPPVRTPAPTRPAHRTTHRSPAKTAVTASAPPDDLRTQR